jgi:hypothetical protein
VPEPGSVSTRGHVRPWRLAILFLVCVMFGVVGVVRAGTATDAPSRAAQLRFMWAMAGQESGWDYYARNPVSGAFGKYQIMPANWPAWSARYLGKDDLDQTPYNQELVAYGKLRDLYGWLGSWRRVAYWWLTGSNEPDQKRWSGYAKGYVRNIMRLRKQAPAGGWSMPAWTSSQAQAGDWRRSGTRQKLHLSPGGPAWRARGLLHPGQLLQVRRATWKHGHRWVMVVAVDGRAGWLAQPRTVPAHEPATPARWHDIKDRGATVDRGLVRPSPH